MDQEIHRAPAVLQRGKAGVQAGIVGHIHIDQEIPIDLAPYPTMRVLKWKKDLDATSGWKRSAPVAAP